MKKSDIPKVVLNYTQVNNPTQVVNEPHENSVQTINRKIVEVSENPLDFADSAATITNNVWNLIRHTL